MRTTPRSIDASGATVQRLRTWVVLALGTAACVYLVGHNFDPRSLGLGDYIAYWSAGRVNAAGGNPYAPEELLPVQRAVGWPEDWPNIMYYPPWALALVMPFGLLPFWVSRMVWLVVQFGLAIGSADLLWRYFDGPRRYRWLAWALALSLVPTLIALRMGQIGPLMLAGIAVFLAAEQRGWDWLAGAALVLPAIKPQLVYLFGLAVLLWAIDRRRWRIAAAGLLAATAATALALWRNPRVLSEYRYALANPPSGNITPTIGAMLRLVFGSEQTWLQFVPTLVGLAWLGWYWRRQRTEWSWARETAVLLLVSFLTTSYGAWIFDVVVLLVPILQAATWITRAGRGELAWAGLAAYGTLDALALAMNLAGATYPSFIWVTPLILVGYLAVRRYTVDGERSAALAQ